MEALDRAPSSTKKCAFCSEEILSEAKKCRYCGEFVKRTSTERGQTRWHQPVAIVGSLLLGIAPFGPVISAPIFGRVTLFHQRKGDGLVLLILAIVATVLSLFGRYAFLWISGAAGLYEVGDLLDYFYRRLPELIDQYKQQTKGNIFGSIGEMTLSNVDPDWGAMVLLISTVCSLLVAASVAIKARKVTLAGAVGFGLFAVVVVYHTSLVLFPYLRFWPSLVGVGK